ncbi:class I SAM-dependent methyltransferase [candidate division WOR-3 bacterium]|nr:class I SAM-dependent methyltransferase [candidate division WOR-3 bacterium]
MKSRILNLFLSLFAKFLRRMTPSKSAGILIHLFRKIIYEIDPKEALNFLFEFENKLYSLEGKTSVKYGGGLHTKHKHIKYHDFFVKNIKPDEKVLDIGSGNGFLCYDIVTKVKGAKVTGIELNEKNVEFARKHYSHDNIRFIKGDALKELPKDKFDVITLSNILEHIEKRVKFLKVLQQRFKPKRFIIRVPDFERDWRVPLKKELGLDYRLDRTHFIEYTQANFAEELNRAGLEATILEYRWGEIWCVAKHN